MRNKGKQQPAAPAVAHSTIVNDGPRAFPILEAFDRIGVGHVGGYNLVKSGELQTFLIGRRRYATSEAIQAFLERCIANSTETAAQRAQKVAKATQASLVSRKQASAGAGLSAENVDKLKSVDRRRGWGQAQE